MFFSITPQPKSNFPCCYKLGQFQVNTDAGWNTAEIDHYQIIYKGYTDQGLLSQHLVEIVKQSAPSLTGNFCAIVYDRSFNNIVIRTDKYRNFPLYYNPGNEITNLQPFDNVVWTNQVLTVDANFEVHLQKFNVIGHIETSRLDTDQIVQQIDAILSKKVQNFIEHNFLPINVFLSGGVDTMLVYSYLKRFNANITMIRGAFFDWDYFWLKNSGDVERNWGYKQIHHWTNDCVLASGSPGDEFMLRSPTTADLYLKYHGIKILELLQEEKWKNCLHAQYFEKEKHKTIFQTQEAKIKNDIHLHWVLCENVVNDWQHWHLGKTLTWTPLRDLDVFKLMLRLPIDDAVSQILNSEISLKLIENNVPGLSRHISDHKNSNNVFSNLVGLVI